MCCECDREKWNEKKEEREEKHLTAAAAPEAEQFERNNIWKEFFSFSSMFREKNNCSRMKVAGNSQMR